MRPGTPARWDAVTQAPRMLFSGRPWRWKTQGITTPRRCSSAVGRLPLGLQTRPELGRHDEDLAFVVLRGPGLQPDRAGLEVHLALLKRQDLAPDAPAGDVGEGNDRTGVVVQVGADSLGLLPLEEPPRRTFCSLSGTIFGRRWIFSASMPRVNMRLSAASSRLMVALAAPSR